MPLARRRFEGCPSFGDAKTRAALCGVAQGEGRAVGDGMSIRLMRLTSRSRFALMAPRLIQSSRSSQPSRGGWGNSAPGFFFLVVDDDMGLVISVLILLSLTHEV